MTRSTAEAPRDGNAGQRPGLGRDIPGLVLSAFHAVHGDYGHGLLQAQTTDLGHNPRGIVFDERSTDPLHLHHALEKLDGALHFSTG